MHPGRASKVENRKRSGVIMDTWIWISEVIPLFKLMLGFLNAFKRCKE